MVVGFGNCGRSCVCGMGVRFGLVFGLGVGGVYFFFFVAAVFVFRCRLCLECIIYMSWVYLWFVLSIVVLS